MNILDGSRLHIAAPKTTHAKDILWDRKQPVFATGPDRIRRYHKGTTIVNAGETNQMDARWVYVHLKHRITNIDNSIVACARCFAKLVLDEDED